MKKRWWQTIAITIQMGTKVCFLTCLMPKLFIVNIPEANTPINVIMRIIVRYVSKLDNKWFEIQIEIDRQTNQFNVFAQFMGIYPSKISLASRIHWLKDHGLTPEHLTYLNMLYNLMD